MSTCGVQATNAIELYFYDEMPALERAAFEQHLAGCAECRRAVAELSEIRALLASRSDVAAPAGGDWSSFMARLDANVRREGPLPGARVVTFHSGTRRRIATYVAMAALIALVTFSVLFVARNRPEDGTDASFRVPAVAARDGGATPSNPVAAMPASAESGEDAAFAALSEQHFERSKLVVLGLATKDARQASGGDWAYERQLASSLLTDTRLYRLAAEQRGMTSIARVMADLELVLLQTSMSEERDPETLEQLQRLIHKRNLVTNMEVVTAGL